MRADAHLDLAMDVAMKRSWGRTNVLEEDYYPSVKRSRVRLIISSLFIENQFLPESGLRKALLQLQALLDDIQESKHFVLAYNFTDIQRIHSQKKIAIMLSFEGIEPLGEDISLLSVFYALGVRGVGVCWARRNAAADGSDFIEDDRFSPCGLRPFSRVLFDKMQKLGMYLDLAHMNEKGFFEALDAFPGSVMVSHANCRSLCDTPRNLSDQQVRAMISRGGFLGINGMNFTVSDGRSLSEDIRGVARHVIHILELGGENQVGLGLDFNDMILPYIPAQQLKLLPRKPFDCLAGYEELDMLHHELKNAGVSEECIQKFMSKNLMRFLQAHFENEEKNGH